MTINNLFAFLGNLSMYHWLDIVVVGVAIFFIILGIVRGISGSIAKVSAYLTTFALGMWCYNTIRASWLTANTYPSKIGAFVIAGLIGLAVGVAVGLLVAKCLRLIVVQPYDSILGIFTSLFCYSVILLFVFFVLKLTPVNVNEIRQNSFSGMMGYAILDAFLLEES